MFTKNSERNYQQPLEGIEMKTLAYGEKTLMSEFRLQKGAILPTHSHPHEQTGYLVSGQLILTIGDESFTVNPGDSWSIPSQAEHQVAVREDSVAIEVFSPVREDYLPR